MTKAIGSSSSYERFPKLSNNWGRKMNEQLVRIATCMHGAVLSMTTPLPASPAVNDTYINPADGKIYVWVDEFTDGATTEPAQWYVITPAMGLLMYVSDEQKFYVRDQYEAWQFVWDLGASHRAVEKELTFYNPYLIRKNAVIFLYCAGTEFTLPAGAPGSGASLDVAATADLTFDIQHNGSPVGTVSFAAGSLSGVVTVPSTVVVHPAIEENMYVQAHTLQIVSRAETYAAEGLSISLKGSIRSID